MKERLVLAVDIGNSRTSLGLFTFEGDLLKRWDISNIYTTEDELLACIFPLISHFYGRLDNIHHVVLASVVEEKKKTWRFFVEKYMGESILIIEHGHIKSIKNSYHEPSKLGIDRLINVYYAYKRYKNSCLVLDFGTATTVNYVDKQGQFHGGLILPGFGLMFKAIYENTDKLPLVEPWDFSEELLCKETKRAIINGTTLGYIELIKGLLRRYKEILPSDTIIIGTGGYGGFFASNCGCIDVYIPDLTLRGIYEVGKDYYGYEERIVV